MGAFSWWHILIVAVVFILFFGGKGKVSDLMGDVAKGIKSFKKGLADDPAEDVKSLEANATEAARKAAEKVQG